MKDTKEMKLKRAITGALVESRQAHLGRKKFAKQVDDWFRYIKDDIEDDSLDKET